MVQFFPMAQSLARQAGLNQIEDSPSAAKIFGQGSQFTGPEVTRLISGI
jgi:hypothetical protein